MKMGRVEKYINDTIATDGGMLFVLIDPVDHKSPEDAAKAAKQSADAGADIILIGGSTGAQGELLDITTKMIKESVDIPITIFPGGVATVSRYADSLYFMTMLNSRNNYWLSIAQTTVAPYVKKLGVEPIPTGYIVVEPGGTVGWVGEANLVPHNKPEIAAALALGGQYMGNRLIVTDAGSNPHLGPIPLEMIKAVAKAIDVPYVVGGGIKTPKQAFDAIASGANAIQVGTAIESGDVTKTVEGLAKQVKKAGKEKK